MQAKTFATIQTTSDSNANAFLAQTKKIYFVRRTPSGSYEKRKLKFTGNFIGLVCPFETPEGVSNVNIKNALARNVNIIDGDPYITVKSKSGEKVQLSFIDYYKSRILSNSYYDYDKNKIVPNNGIIKILFQGKYYTMEYIDDSQFDYLEESEDSILGYNASLIPFMNHNDSVRLSMATNMMNQAEPIIGGRKPTIYTGQEAEVYNESDMNFRAQASGVVTGIYKEFVKIKTDDGKLVIQSAPPSMQSVNHTTNLFLPCVKEGDRVKEGDVIISSNSFKDKELALCVPAITLPMMFEGYGDDDDFIVSSDIAHLFSHIQERTIDIEIPKNLRCIFDLDTFKNYLSDNLSQKRKDNLNKLNKFGLPEVGQVFNRGDIIAVYMQESDIESNDLAKLKLKIIGEVSYDPFIIQLPAGMMKGEVISVDLVVKPGITEMNKVRDYYDDLFEEDNKKLMSFLENEMIVKKERPSLSSNTEFRCIARIKFRSILPAKMGDKICNRFGGKGVIGKVVNSEDMPRIGGPDGPRVQIIMGPNSISNRKNLGTSYEGSLGWLSKLMYDKVGELIKSSDFDTIRLGLNTLYVTDDFSNYSDKDLVDFYNKFEDYFDLKASAFNKTYNPDTIEKIYNFFGDDFDGTYNIYNPLTGELTENKCIVYVNNFMRLHFNVDDKVASTGKYYTGDPVYRIGKYRPGGQKIGEQEVAIYMSKGRIDLIESMFEKSTTERVKPLIESELLLQGLMIKPI